MTSEAQDRYVNFILPIMTNPNYSEDKKANIISEMIDEFSKHYPKLEDHTTKDHLKETELRLLEKITENRLEIEKVRKDLTIEIEKNRTEIEKVRKDLTIEIEKNRTEIEKVRADLIERIENTKSSIIKWSFLFWISQFGAIIGLGFMIYRTLNH